MGETEHIGDLSVDSPRPSTAPQSQLTEELVAELIYPLRNMARYRRAEDASGMDPLAKLNNRSSLDSMLSRELRLAHWDTVLKTVAGCIVNCVRDSDTVFRFGGEEFCVLLSNTDASGASRLAERIRASIEGLVVDADGEAVHITASLGIAELEPGEEKVDFLRRAGRALYRSKRDGRNLVTAAS